MNNSLTNYSKRLTLLHFIRDVNMLILPELYIKSEEKSLYLLLLSRDSTTYCEGVFRLSLLKTSTFLGTKDTVVNAPPVYDYVGRRPSCLCVLHIKRVWSTIVYFGSTLSKTFSRIYENGPTPLLFIYHIQSGVGWLVFIDMEKKVIEYCAPILKVINLEIKSRIMQTSPGGDAEGEIPGQNVG